MWLGLLALLVAQFIGGAGGPLAIKLGVKEFPPLTFTFLRFFFATIILLPIYLREKNKPSRVDWKNLFTKSIFFSFNAAFFSIGIQYTTAIMSQILYTLVPVIVLFFAYVLLKEKITMPKIVGLVVSSIGVSFLIEQSIEKADLFSFGHPLGNFFVLCAVFSWAFYFVFSKQLQKKYSIATITFSNFLTAVVILSLTIPFELYVRPLVLKDITIVGIGSLLYVAVFLSAIMIFLMQFGVKRTNAFSASLFSYMGPLFALFTAIPFLGERLTIGLVVGGVLILTGVFYATTYEQVRKQIRSVLQ